MNRWIIVSFLSILPLTAFAQVNPEDRRAEYERQARKREEWRVQDRRVEQRRYEDRRRDYNRR